MLKNHPKNTQTSEFTIIKSSSTRTESEIIKDNIKILTFLNPLGLDTQKKYKNIIRSFFAYYENFKIDQIESHHIESYLAGALKGRASTTRSLHKSTLSSLFKFLVKDGYIDKDPTFALKPIKIDRMKFSSSVPEEEDLLVLWKVCDNERDKLIIQFLYESALRASEFLKLTFADFKRPKNGSVKFTFSGKGGKTRVGQISEELFLAIKSLDGYKPNAPLFRRLRSKCDQGITYSALYAILFKLSEKAGLGYTVSPHKYRHAHGTHYLENGGNIMKLRDRYGHATVRTTEQYTKTANINFSEVKLNVWGKNE